MRVQEKNEKRFSPYNEAGALLRVNAKIPTFYAHELWDVGDAYPELEASQLPLGDIVVTTDVTRVNWSDTFFEVVTSHGLRWIDTHWFDRRKFVSEI